MKKFIFGAVLGAAAGLLFAPKKGKELREDIVFGLEDLYGKIQDFDAEETKEFLLDRLNELKAEVYDIDKEKIKDYSHEAYVAIRNKAEQIYEYSRLEGFPMLVEKSKHLLEELDITITTKDKCGCGCGCDEESTEESQCCSTDDGECCSTDEGECACAGEE